jgi:SPP1 gp7 family putative phage head morphogenesis protein
MVTRAKVPLPQEAIDYLASKKIYPAFDAEDVYAKAHQRAFTVAKLLEKELLQDVHDSLVAALAEGKPFRQWADEIEDELDDSGWGAFSMEDDAPTRLKLIYDTNMRTARAAGQWSRIEKTKSVMPYLQYNIGPSRVHRPEHEELDGMVLPVDSPFWKVGMPPNGFGCRCGIDPLTAEEAEEIGIDEEPPVDVEWEGDNGETLMLPYGVEPAFAYNPGMVDEADQDQAITSNVSWKRK